MKLIALSLIAATAPEPITLDAKASYAAWTSGAYDPAAWTGGETAVTDSWSAATVVLRPLA